MQRSLKHWPPTSFSSAPMPMRITERIGPAPATHVPAVQGAIAGAQMASPASLEPLATETAPLQVASAPLLTRLLGLTSRLPNSRSRRRSRPPGLPKCDANCVSHQHIMSLLQVIEVLEIICVSFVLVRVQLALSDSPPEGASDFLLGGCRRHAQQKKLRRPRTSSYREEENDMAEARECSNYSIHTM